MFALGIFLATWLAAPFAGAQVAVPNLSPFSATLLSPVLNGNGINGVDTTPDNPAALGWGEGSKVTLGFADGDTTDNITGTETESVGGYFLGGRWHGEALAVAFDRFEIDESIASVTETTGNLQVAYVVDGLLSVGIGWENSHRENSGGNTFDTKNLSIGLSLKFAEMYYVGLALGSSDYETSAGQTAERDTTMFGAGFRVEGDWSWYGEYYVLNLDEFQNSAGATVKDGTSLTVLAVQTVWQDVLLGFASKDLEFSTQTNLDITWTQIDLGYIPSEKWTVSLRWDSISITNAAGTVDQSQDKYTLAAGYQF